MSPQGTATGQDAEVLELAREFAAGEVAPHAAEWDAAGALPDTFLTTLAEMGFFGMPVGEEFGGLGLGAPVYHQVLAALAEADPSVALTVAEHGAVARSIEAFAPVEVARELLPGMAEGTRIGAMALLETGTDPDPRNFETGTDTEHLNGSKRAVVNASRATVFLVGADAGGAPAVELIDSRDGVQVTGRAITMGLSALEFAEVSFADASVRARLGRDGSAALEGWAAFARAGIAATAVGIARSSLQHAIAYSEERSQFGTALSGFDAIQGKLAEVATRCWGAEAALAAFAATLDRSESDRMEDRDARAAAVKIMASESAMFAADEAVQIFGGYGYMRDYPVEKRMRDAKGTEVLGGTNEALKRILARRLLMAARSS